MIFIFLLWTSFCLAMVFHRPSTTSAFVSIQSNSRQSSFVNDKFGIKHIQTPICSCYLSSKDQSEDLRTQAEELRAKAQELRMQVSELRGIAEEKEKSKVTISSDVTISSVASTKVVSSPWRVPPADNYEGLDYRLYVDIGREQGTWMDPRWGASGRRIDFSLDVRFIPKMIVSDDKIRNLMVKDNFGGVSSQIMTLQSSTKARLRQGLDQMKCDGGAYRIDTDNRGAKVVRFFITTDGTPERDSMYGDIFIPKGCLYFSLPVFGSISNMSRKEGPVTVRQTGWHTGWRREESRIVGTFRASSIVEAITNDGY